MTKKNLWLGILAIALVFAMTVVGCGDDSTNDNGGGGGGGTFTLTGIPSTYNGKYAILNAGDEEGEGIWGFQTINMSTGIVTLPVISNGSVSIPLWVESSSGNSFTRYSGNHTFIYVDVGISNHSIYDESELNGAPIAAFGSVTFSNGSAARSWSQGRVE